MNHEFLLCAFKEKRDSGKTNAWGRRKALQQILCLEPLPPELPLLDLVQVEGWLGGSRFMGGAEGVVLCFWSLWVRCYCYKCEFVVFDLPSSSLLICICFFFLVNLCLFCCILFSLKFFEFFVHYGTWVFKTQVPHGKIIKLEAL